MVSDLLKSYLTQSGMAEAHAAVVARFPWFLHVSEQKYLADIRANGLQPRNPGCAPPDEVMQIAFDTIVCLRPVGGFDTTPHRGQPRFLVAVEGNALPPLVGLDWSYGGCWNLADVIHASDPQRPAADIFCEVVRRWGSIVAYCELLPATLHVWTTNTNRDQPETWPLIADASEGDIATF